MSDEIYVPRCEACGQETFATYAEPHDCVEGRAACATGAHAWIDVTALGDSEQELLCCRPTCGARARLPLPELATT